MTLLLVGMPLSILAGALAAKLILPELIILEALILAVILAPTDAALGQVVVSSPRVPEQIRQQQAVAAMPLRLSTNLKQGNKTDD